MSERISRKRAPGAGRPTLSPSDKKRRVQLYLNPELAAFLEAEDQPEADRARVARRRKQEAAEMLLKANIQSHIL